MHVAAKVGFLPWVRDAEAFDLEAYQHYEQVQHGDLNWVLPGKLLAFAGPTAVSKVIPRPPAPPLPPPPSSLSSPSSRPPSHAHGGAASICSCAQVLCIVDGMVN